MGCVLCHPTCPNGVKRMERVPSLRSRLPVLPSTKVDHLPWDHGYAGSTEPYPWHFNVRFPLRPHKVDRLPPLLIRPRRQPRHSSSESRSSPRLVVQRVEIPLASSYPLERVTLHDPRFGPNLSLGSRKGRGFAQVPGLSDTTRSRYPP